MPCANHIAAGVIGFRAVTTSQCDDAERYMRNYAAYEQFLAMSNQEAEDSGSGIKRTRTYIPREREEAEQRVLDDYFGDDETPPKYPEENFRQRSDATGRASISPILKCTSAIRQLAYGTSPDAFDEYLQIPERCSRDSVADQRLWIWHAYFEVSDANNDLNVLYDSSLFDDFLSDTAPEAPFVVNGRTYKKDYYLADGIYPTWSSFVKTFTIARDEKTLMFKRVQESARRDIERAFGVLQTLGNYTTTGTKKPYGLSQRGSHLNVVPWQFWCHNTFADVAALFSAMAQAMARR
ncbi:RNA-directed DNA polymerase, eukaryota, partial [Tanacetum coccineum]